ncbi:hypothetical protein HY025_04045 [Candidatus Daviesbacteria bacterium]|nr:hypothetical protein [Candidatus Daviesbacteria bacterium]
MINLEAKLAVVGSCPKYDPITGGCLTTGELPSRAILKDGERVCGVSRRGRPANGYTREEVFAERQALCDGNPNGKSPEVITGSGNGQVIDRLKMLTTHPNSKNLPVLVRATCCPASYYTDLEDPSLHGMIPAEFILRLNKIWGAHDKHGSIPPFETLPLFTRSFLYKPTRR